MIKKEEILAAAATFKEIERCNALKALKEGIEAFLCKAMEDAQRCGKYATYFVCNIPSCFNHEIPVELHQELTEAGYKVVRTSSETFVVQL